MGKLLGFDPRAPYSRRVAALKAARIAVWDVLHSCVREGSLDTSIEAEIANDFAQFFRRHPHSATYFSTAPRLNPAIGGRCRRKSVPGSDSLACPRPARRTRR
jgi:hypothetical protein